MIGSTHNAKNDHAVADRPGLPPLTPTLAMIDSSMAASRQAHHANDSISFAHSEWIDLRPATP
jgi:hypothetical protein